MDTHSLHHNQGQASASVPADVRRLDELLNDRLRRASTDGEQNEQLRQKLAIKQALTALPDDELAASAAAYLAELSSVGEVR